MDNDKMTVRFTLTEKWQNLWFRKRKPLGKLLHYYMYDSCNIAGIWEVDLEQAAFSIGANEDDIKGAYKGLARCYDTLNGARIYLVSFLEHQRNLPLNIKNAAHATIVNLLLPYKDLSGNILQLLSTKEIKELTRGLTSPLSISISKGTSRSKGKSISTGNEKEKVVFDKARKEYYGTKDGLGTEFANYIYHCEHPVRNLPVVDWRKALPKLLPAIENQKAWREGLSAKERPFAKNFKTWINNRCWEQEMAKGEGKDDENKKGKLKLFPITGKKCCRQKCKLPAVYKDTSGSYDHHYCQEHMPEEVKKMYG